MFWYQSWISNWQQICANIGIFYASNMLRDSKWYQNGIKSNSTLESVTEIKLNTNLSQYWYLLQCKIANDLESILHIFVARGEREKRTITRGYFLRVHLSDFALTLEFSIIWDIDWRETINFCVPDWEHEAQATLFLLSESSIFRGTLWFFEDSLNKNRVACASCSQWGTEKLIISHESTNSTSQMMENLSYQAKPMRLTINRSPQI